MAHIKNVSHPTVRFKFKIVPSSHKSLKSMVKIHIVKIHETLISTCADPEHFLRGVQIPRRGLTENFNIAKIYNLAIPGGGGGGLDPLSPPLDPPMF